MSAAELMDAAALDRFWGYVDRGDNCWEWRGNINDSGYGRFWIAPRNYRAHRLAWELAKGTSIPEGLVIDHLCRNRACVNPDHLEPVTIVENVLRGDTWLAAKVATTHCPQGHELSVDNLEMWAGRRKCKKCARAHSRDAWRRASKAARFLGIAPTEFVRLYGTSAAVVNPIIAAAAVAETTCHNCGADYINPSHPGRCALCGTGRLRLVEGDQ